MQKENPFKFSSQETEYEAKIPAYMQQSEFVKKHVATQGDTELVFDEYKVTGDGNCGFSALGVSRQDAVKILTSLVEDEKAKPMIIEELLRSMDNFRTSSMTESDPTQFMDSKIQEKFKESYDRLCQLGSTLTTALKKLHQLLQAQGVSLPEGGNTEENMLNHIRQNSLDNWIKVEPKLKEEISSIEKVRLEKWNEILADKNLFNAYVKSYDVQGRGLWLGTTSMAIIAKTKKIGLNLWSQNKSSGKLQLLPESISAVGLSLGAVNVLIIGGHYNFLVEARQIPRPTTLTPDEKELKYEVIREPISSADTLPRLEKKETKILLQKINWNNKHIKEKDLISLIKILQSIQYVNCLYLSCSRLKISQIQTLLSAIKEYKGLSDLNLRENMLAGGAKNFEDLLDCFPELKMLNLNQTQLNKECIQFLSKALRRHSQLVFLDIGFNNLKDDGLEPLLAALEVIKRPFDLRVAGNLLTDKIANHIIMLLTNNRIVFSHLTIDNNPQISKSKIVEIQELIKMKYAPYSSKFLTKGKISPAMPTSSVSPKKLTSLDFSDNESFGQQLSLITATLEQNPSVKELNLSGNGWGDKENMQILIKGLARSQIVIFDFSKNNLGPEGAELLAEWLKENKSLKELNLSHNQLGAEGTNILVKSLSKHPTLKKLNLDDNALEDKGTETLATNLLHHPSLEYLSLQNNKIRERGARALLSFLKNKSKNSLLYEIKISKDLFIPNLYYQTLQIAIRFWCYLPSQDRLLRLHLDENGKYMILIDSEASLLEKIIKFLQEIMTFSEEKSKEACSNYPKYIEHCKKELEENAHNVLKERGVALIAEKEITAQIAGICAMYEDVHIKSLDISKLMVRLQELKEVYNNYMEENAQYIEQLSQIKEELLDIEVWKLLLDPAPNPDHENIDSHTGVSLLTSPFTLMGNSSAMASSSSTSSERTGETLSK